MYKYRDDITNDYEIIKNTIKSTLMLIQLQLHQLLLVGVIKNLLQTITSLHLGTHPSAIDQISTGA